MPPNSNKYTQLAKLALDESTTEAERTSAARQLAKLVDAKGMPQEPRENSYLERLNSALEAINKQNQEELIKLKLDKKQLEIKLANLESVSFNKESEK